jgi:hypothetical protein
MLALSDGEAGWRIRCGDAAPAAGRSFARDMVSLWCPAAPRLARTWQPEANPAWACRPLASEAGATLAAVVIAAAAVLSCL